MKQGSKEWLAYRNKKIGASDAPVIMKVSPWCTPYKLWQQKLGFIEPQKQNYAMQKGLENEPMARLWFNSKTNLGMEATIVDHPGIEFMMASLDGLSFCGTHILEIKCAGKDDHKIAMKGKVPEKYYPQLQHQLACVPTASFAYYLSYDERYPDRSKIIEVPRDPEYIQKMIESEEKFYLCMLNKEAPDMDENDYENVDFYEDWTKLLQEFKEKDEMVKQAELAKEELRKKLIAKSAGKNITGSGIRITHRFTRGAVEYKNIPELFDVDLDKYRKPGQVITRVTFTERSIFGPNGLF